jgi:NAD(P)-dependent dehydrogenase (short-subunit alcohol dehydrogenase family)
MDYAVNCAGVSFDFRASTDTEIDIFDRINSVNYRGVWLCSREELKIMKTQPVETLANAQMPEFRRQRGAIVNISSSLDLASVPNNPAYTTAKAGVIGITRADVLDYSEHRIRVNPVLPGIVLTPMTNIPGLKEGMEETTVKHGAPMRRWGHPEEIADVVVFLCDTKASFLLGTAWTVDGGFLIQWGVKKSNE